MASNDKTGRPAAKTYEPPRLTVHGDVKDLTQGPGKLSRMSDAPAFGRRGRDGTVSGS